MLTPWEPWPTTAVEEVVATGSAAVLEIGSKLRGPTDQVRQAGQTAALFSVADSAHVEARGSATARALVAHCRGCFGEDTSFFFESGDIVCVGARGLTRLVEYNRQFFRV
jgi:hypothetical protein